MLEKEETNFDFTNQLTVSSVATFHLTVDVISFQSWYTASYASYYEQDTRKMQCFHQNLATFVVMYFFDIPW